MQKWCSRAPRSAVFTFYCFKRSVLPPDRRRVSHTAGAATRLPAASARRKRLARLLPSEQELLLRSSGDSFPAPAGSTPGVSTWLFNSYFISDIIANPLIDEAAPSVNRNF